MNAPDAESYYGENLPDAMLLQTALCYLMTRYTRCPCSGLACTIVHRLQLLLLPATGDLLSRGVVTQQPVACASGILSPCGVTH
jgi:hypothetical protein